MDAALGQSSQSSGSLSVSDKISVVNTLLAEDRQEVRNHHEALLRLSYFMVPAFIGVAAFYDAHGSLKAVLIIGQLLLLALYVAVYLVTFLRWLTDARASLRIREAYYTNHQELLHRAPFEPLRPATREDYDKRMRDRYLWFPFGVSVIAAVVTLAYMVFS